MHFDSNGMDDIVTEISSLDMEENYKKVREGKSSFVLAQWFHFCRKETNESHVPKGWGKRAICISSLKAAKHVFFFTVSLYFAIECFLLSGSAFTEFRILVKLHNT